MTYKQHPDKPTKKNIDKYLMLLEWAKKNDYKITINKTNNLKSNKMESNNNSNEINKGFLFKNDSKKTENHPDYTGKIVLSNNVEHYLSAWVKSSKSGNKYLSIAIGNETQPKIQPKVEPKKIETESDEFLF
jgi:uncharacterized protein (DUF736 family)